MMPGALSNSSQNRARIAFEYRTARQAGRILILSAIPVRLVAWCVHEMDAAKKINEEIKKSFQPDSG
jgi:hypothetical protein